MATELKLRRDVEGDIDAMTPAEAEPIYDITNKRLRVGDGSTAGGLHLGAAADIQKQIFVYAAATGTDTLTLTLDPPLASYTTGLKVSFKAANNNTGTVTININGLGAKTIKRATGANDLLGNDLVSGGLYDIGYDGTNFQLLTNLFTITIIRKTANETVNNSTTLQDDNHLFAALAANEIVFFSALIIHVGNATADFKLAWTVPAGATLRWSMPNARVSAAEILAGASVEIGSGVAISCQGSTSRLGQLVHGLVRNAATPGNLQLQWAQNTAAVVDTIVQLDSFFTVWRA